MDKKLKALFLAHWLVAMCSAFIPSSKSSRLQCLIETLKPSQLKGRAEYPGMDSMLSGSIRTRTGIEMLDSYSNGSSDKVKQRPGKDIAFYLISFPNLYDTDEKSRTVTEASNDTSKSNKALKDWKEYCLGDGGVYFDQRPNALKALNTLLAKVVTIQIIRHFDLEKDDWHKLTVETAVLSTCARFEILVAVELKDLVLVSKNEGRNSGDTIAIRDLVNDAILSSIARQIMFQQQRISYRIQKRLPLNIFDRPSRIRQDLPIHIENGQNDLYDSYIQSLKDELLFTGTNHAVIERLCLIASGLQDRPIFRPFSARDSHIMQQLKRTSDGAISVIHENPLSDSVMKPEQQPQEQLQQEGMQSLISSTIRNSTYCKVLFDAALQSGKAARSSKVVPILDELREMSKGADGPLDLSAAAAESAKIMAVAPAVISCTSKLRAMMASSAITELRDRATLLAKEANMNLNGNEGKDIRSLLHGPTIQLRQGELVDVEKVLKEVEAVTTKLNSKTNQRSNV